MKSWIKRGMLALRAAAVLLAAAMLINCCGCAWVGSALEGLGESGNSSGSSGGSQSEATASAAPSATASLPVNPVFELFGEFVEDYNSCSEGLLQAVSAQDDAALAGAYARLRGCEAELSVIFATIGMLGYDSPGWSGSFTGAYAGSGNMNSRGTFSYAFEDGSSIAGRMSEGLLYFGIGTEPEAAIPDEPTPLPTEEAESTADASEGADATPEAELPTDTPEAALPTNTPEAVPSVVTGDAGWAELWSSSSGNADKLMALKSTDEGWVGVVQDGAGLSILEICGNELYFASADANDYPGGFDPLGGIASYASGGLGIEVFCYSIGSIPLLNEA